MMVLSVLNYLQIFLLLDKLLLVQHCNGEVVYVTPTPPPNQDCPHGMPCQTLQQYFNNQSFIEQRDNLTLIFMSGEHAGFYEKTAIKSAAFNVTGIGERVTIECTNIELINAAAIYFENVTLDHWYISSLLPSTALVVEMLSVIAQNQTYVYIEHARNVGGNFVLFNNCTFKNSSLLGRLYFSQFVGGTFKGGVMNLLSSTLSLGKNNTSVTFDHNIMQYAAMYLNSSTLDVENASMFFFNNQRAIMLFKSTLNVMKSNVSFVGNAANHSGGGALYVYNSTMNVNSSEMSLLNNSAIGGGALYAKSSALSFSDNTRIVFKHNSANGSKGVYVPLCQAQSITVDNPEGVGGALRMGFSTLLIRFNTSIIFIGNLAFLQGGAINVYYKSTMIVDNASNVTFIGNSANYAAGALSCAFSTFIASRNTIIIFMNSQSNEAGALFAENSIVKIENNANVTFYNNTANFGGAIILMPSATLNISSGAALSFISNRAKTSGGAVYSMLSTIIIGDKRDVCTLDFINNSAINEGGGIFFLSSNLFVEDNVSTNYTGNSASRGGAMALVSSQIEFLSANSPNMTFEKNIAEEFGGAIYINPDRLKYLPEYINYVNCTYAPCLYSNPHGMSSNNTKHSLYFSQNLAKLGGYDIHGASLQLCNGSFGNTKNNDLSSVSGSPTRVCKCSEHDQPQCHEPSHIYITESIYPSEIFTISAVIVGGEWGLTTGIVYANFTQPNALLKPSSQYTQRIDSLQCTELKYNIYSNQSVELMLSVNLLAPGYYQFCGNSSNYKESVCKYFSPLYINLNVLPCPPGFSLQGNPPGCNCLTILSDLGVRCSIKKRRTRFYWNTALWMNITMNDTIYSENCPFDYCKEVKKIDYDSDVQCAFNHAGRLCGSCKENYSLAIGSSHCIYCHSNNSLALLIFFAAAGFLLVLFISILNLTVTEGMINGFIFYANIVLRYQSILFPEKMHKTLFFLKIFIAWLNLDFGIETCFVKDLNAFWKTWVQFVFPLYVWSITGIIIVVARCSTRITSLLGNRAVPVLATLILLSYNKLLRTSVDVLDFSLLIVYESERNITNSVVIVWSIDGTLEYFRYPHILLFIVALLTLLCLWLPYTLLLLLVQWLRRISHLWILKWTTRFNPFYDAYFAPLKPKHQYWFGVLLIARSVILITFASNFAIPPDISLIILLTSAGVLLFYMSMRNVHKYHSVMAFQGIFFLNLCLLSGFMIYAHTRKKVRHSLQAAVVGLSTGVVFLQFCCLIFYQIYSMFCSNRRSVLNVPMNEEQVHAILDINARSKNIKHPAEIEPLLTPDQISNDRRNNAIPTY